MQKIKTIITTQNRFNGLILRIVEKNIGDTISFGSHLEFLWEVHSETVKIPKCSFIITMYTTYPMSSSTFQIIKIDDAWTMFLRHMFISAINSSYFYAKEFTPSHQINATQRFIYEFHSFIPIIGILVSFTFLFTVLFFFIPKPF